MSEAGGQISEAPAGLPATETGERERLHPLTFFTGLGAALRNAWGAVLGGIFFISQGRAWIAFMLVGVVLVASLVSILLRYLSFSYRVEDDEIDMASGILNRNQRSIPFDRIQDVNIEQGPLHRLVKLARVKFETGASAGNKQDDGSLDSITLERANELRDLIRAHRAGTTIKPPVAAEGGSEAETVEEAEERAPVFVMDMRRLLLAALFSFSLAIVGALFGLAQTYGDALGFDMFDPGFWIGISSQFGPLEAYMRQHQIVSVIFGIVTLVFAGFLTGIIRTIPRDWGFKLRRTETGFRRQRGLFTLTDVVLPLKRVQAAIRFTGPLKRRSGFYELKIQSLGRDTGNSGDHVVAPLATRDEISTIMAEMEWRPIPEVDDSWQRPRPAFVTSSLFGLVILFGTIGLGVSTLIQAVRLSQGEIDAFDFTQWGLIFGAIALIPTLLGTVFRFLDYRHRRHRVDSNRFLMRQGWWRQRMVVLPLDRIQSADVKRNVIDRWFGIADLKLGVAGGSGFAAHGIEAIDFTEIYALRETLLDDA
ncbi:PH domain-containing protein [Sphingomicrobium sediminis]|uniref:PH domain-containing protein n=1 Tax=Sphingomicrobium sediminis TaxID=2950949 RepID=A0A9X2EJ45_9SPHN|nr:PH domain-containing protein [Sphingomicrobium sediminis]MCM8558455.1 PH domain-containing protein [Sphingomicrobium sediminis]